MKSKLTEEVRRLRDKATAKAWRIANKEKIRIKNDKHRRANLEKHNALNKAFMARNPGYGTKITQNRQEKLAGRRRPKKCDVCKSAENISFDHCHSTNSFRGWLCHGCNVAIGFARDNPKILRKLADYLEAHTAKQKLLSKKSTLAIMRKA